MTTIETALAPGESEANYRTLFEQSPIPKWVYDVQTLCLVAVNEAALAQYGYTRDEFLSLRLLDLSPAEAHERIQTIVASGPRGTQEGVYLQRRKSGATFEALITSLPLVLGGRAVRLAVVRDVTETRRLEEQLRQAQKMEAIGLLAGGLAHDFNNLLSIILSYTAMMLDGLDPSDPLRADLTDVQNAGIRAAELTRQLLAFGRRQVLQPRVVDLGEIVSGMQKLLARVLRDDVQLRVTTEPGLGHAFLDPGQIEQVVMNLVVNASDAMPDGGSLVLETASALFDEDFARAHPGVVPGPHVLLRIADTGSGIDQATRQHIFEPFFTTKEQGRGTGLGLSTVLGIVKQSRGHIWLESEPGRGTTFTVAFPRAASTASPVAVESPMPQALRGTEAILLVDDDDQVRQVVGTILRRAGYQVHEAPNGGEALVFSERHPGKLDLVVTDVVMKHLTGTGLAERLALQRPDVKVLFMSGYPSDVLAPHGVLDPLVAFLAKPITPLELLRKVRQVLQGGSTLAAVRGSLVPASRATILVVDDDETVRLLVRKMLAPTEMRVLEAESSSTALALLDAERLPPHLLLTDVVLPELDGKALATRVLARHPALPVLFMSGYDVDVVARHGVEASDDFLPKPFSSRTLRERVGRALSRAVPM